MLVLQTKNAVRKTSIQTAQTTTVSKKMSDHSKAIISRANSPARHWSIAVQQARKALGLKGFVPIGGDSKEGRELYGKVVEIFEEGEQRRIRENAARNSMAKMEVAGGRLLKVFPEAVEMQADSASRAAASSLYNTGHCLKALGREDEARSFLTRADEMLAVHDPDSGIHQRCREALAELPPAQPEAPPEAPSAEAVSPDRRRWLALPVLAVVVALL